MRSFTYSGHAARVVFGAGTVAGLAAEVERLGRRRALVVGSAGLAARAQEALGPLAVAGFTGVAQHTPVEVSERALAVAREHDADCVVSIGGGSATGLGKALAVRGGLVQVAVPTTYAGSEVTAVLGETAGGRKTTMSAPAVLPRAVIYDVELTLGLPVQVAVTSGVNALAHAVEALYSPDANPVTDAMAVEAVRSMAGALQRIVADPADLDARADALLAAWLAGTCLGTVRMGLHHKLCHVLGGSFGLPHAETHTVVLPHAMAYNAPAAEDAMRRIAGALGVADAPAGMADLVSSLGGPTSLRGLGLAASDLDRAAALAVAEPYPNPRETTEAGVSALLRDAWSGVRPAGPGDLTGQVVASFDKMPDRRTRQLLTDLVRHLHRFAVSNDLTQGEWERAIDFLTRTGQLSSATRQEFVLLSDTLGVSSMVDLLTNSRSPHATSSAVLGPFYVDGPPEVANGSDISTGLPGTPLWTDVKITDLQGLPLPRVTVDVWQSNKDGFYDVQLPDLEGPVLRARLRTGDDGRVTFWSILPSAYPIPDDGPVGELLRAAGRHPFRAPHLHFLIDAPGHRRLVTQLFVSGGAYLDSDAVFGVKTDLVVDFAPQHGPTPDGRVVEGEWRLLEFTFRIAPEEAS
jgi:alcohol dehydrogenase class IV/protocatechuate 3,4-dioxygenase beta subunit